MFCAYRIDDGAHVDQTLEIAESERQQPWPSGIHAKSMHGKLHFRAVLISMEAGARMKEHHVDGWPTNQLRADLQSKRSARLRFDRVSALRRSFSSPSQPTRHDLLPQSRIAERTTAIDPISFPAACDRFC
jgi:hypothetical protein